MIVYGSAFSLPLSGLFPVPFKGTDNFAHVRAPHPILRELIVHYSLSTTFDVIYRKTYHVHCI